MPILGKPGRISDNNYDIHLTINEHDHPATGNNPWKSIWTHQICNYWHIYPMDRTNLDDLYWDFWTIYENLNNKLMWNTYNVSFWDHPKHFPGWVNDCFGNSISRQTKARNEQEAIRKIVKVRQKETLSRCDDFRLRKCEIVEY